MALKKQENFLDFIPVRVPKHSWSADENGRVTVHMLHDGFYDRIAQRFFHRPRISNIDLDAQGSFVWQHIDGQSSVGQIGLMVRERFGEAVDPLYERLAEYMKILYNNGFIGYHRARRDGKPKR